MGVGARAFAQFGIERDVASQQCLQAGADVPDDAAGTDDDAADDAEGFRDAIAGKFKSGAYEFWIYRYTYFS